MNSIKAVVNEPIDGHEEYHMMVNIFDMFWKELSTAQAEKIKYWVHAQCFQDIQNIGACSCRRRNMALD